MGGTRRSRGCDKEIPHCVLPIEHLVLSDQWVRLPSANQDKTSLYFQGPSPVHCTGLRLSLTLSQTSMIPGAKQIIS